MVKKPKPIQSNLFRTYSLIIILIVTLVTTFFNVWMSRLLQQEAFNSIGNTCRNFSDQLDGEIQSMSDISLNVCYSNLVKDRLAQYGGDLSQTQASNDSYAAATRDDAKKLIDILTAIIGPSRPVQQIYLYDLNGGMFGTGFDNLQYRVDVQNKDWYADVRAAGGNKVVARPEKDEMLSKFISNNRNIYYVSLRRMYFSNYSVEQGVVEVKQYADSVFASLNRYSKANLNDRVYVYNHKGETVYPYGQESEENPAYFALCTSPQGDSLIVQNPRTGKKELVSYTSSQNTGWTVVIATDEATLLGSVRRITGMIIGVTVFIILTALLFSFRAAEKFTRPINLLCSNLRSADLQNFGSEDTPELNSGLIEIEELNRAFHKMSRRIRQSVDDVMLAQEHELNSRILALQSQMNPHFLFNTMATISAMAEDGMNDETVLMCENICDMLRYISSENSELVELSTELAYTEKYLVCMKFRHGEALRYAFDTRDCWERVKIPKLVIQPLVENAIKACALRQPPWNITVTAAADRTFWRVTVQDDGPGFSEEKLAGIRQKIDEIEEKNNFPQLEIDGMGLMNIFIRLRLMYGKERIFEITNREQGGTAVTIGGSFSDKREAFLDERDGRTDDPGRGGGG